MNQVSYVQQEWGMTKNIHLIWHYGTHEGTVYGWLEIRSSLLISSVESLSCVQLFATPWTTARQVSLSITNSWVHPNPFPWSQWCHPTISSSVIPFFSCPQSFPASGSFQISQLFASGGQSMGVSASTSVPPVNTQDWSPLGWTGWISLQSKGLSTPQFKSINSLAFSFLYSPTLTLTHDHWKNHRRLDEPLLAK